MSHYLFTFSYTDVLDSRLFWPALATVSVLLLVIQKLYSILRPKFSVKVNCWFCNFRIRIPYSSSNSWYCPECDQYNGFTPDGGYNRLLPEQYKENPNNLSYSSKTKRRSPANNGLCRFCNINLELKVQQLAQFVPFNKNNYDEEVQQYSDQLERVYRLCNRCQDVLKKTLHKQEVLVTTQNQQYMSTFRSGNKSQIQDNKQNRHMSFTFLTSVLSLGLLLSVLPYNELYSLLPPDLTSVVEQYLPYSSVSSVVASAKEIAPWLSYRLITTSLLVLGVVTHVCELAYTRELSSFVNLLLWILLLSLTKVPIKVGGLVTISHVLGSVVFLISSILEARSGKNKSVATVKPVQLKKLDQPLDSKLKKKVVKEEISNKPTTLTSPVSEPPLAKPSHPSPPSFVPTPEDFGFGSLSVSPKRVTRSQTKHFQTKSFCARGETELFTKSKFNLSPPKLNVDNISSTSSGFFSMSNHKEYYRTPSPSAIDENIESVSQVGENRISPYHPHIFPPTNFPQPYGISMSNFSNFPPYTVMHFSPPFYNKLQYSNMITYEPSLNLSGESVLSQPRVNLLETVKNVLSSMMFFFLITTNIAVLWTVFGKDYLKA